jgi:hypothetical protein
MTVNDEFDHTMEKINTKKTHCKLCLVVGKLCFDAMSAMFPMQNIKI